MDDATLVALIARLLPADGDPDGVALGGPDYVRRHLAWDPEAARLVASGMGHPDFKDFGSRDVETQDAVLRRHEHRPWLRLLAELVAEAAYADPGNGGNPGGLSWAMLDYRPGLPEGPSGPEARDGRPPKLHSGTLDYDVIIVGAGAGGTVAACILAEAGRSVLLLERGVERNYADSGHRDHLRNHRLSLYGHNAGPDLEGNPRVFVRADGSEAVVSPHEADYHNLAAGVGSGTLLYGAMAWRFHRDDFHMASLYGVPEASSLVDWPLSYDDLAPWYERIEWELGVAGDADSLFHEGQRQRPFPLPPLPRAPQTGVLAAGADRLGLRTMVPPLAINAVPRDGRKACIGCGACVGFPCPSDAKNGAQNTFLPRALASGRCELATGVMVRNIDTDTAGKVIGATFTQSDGTVQSVRAKTVIVAAGAIETARLLLNSSSAREPAGLGNNRDQVGRHLQGHVYPVAYGLFESMVHALHGPGVTIGTTQFNHGNAEVIGGGLLADDFIMPPILFWKAALPPDLRRWGHDAKDFMRDNYHRVLRLTGPVHEIPSPESRITVSRSVTDRFGLPVARLSGTIHPETLKTARFMQQRAFEWLDASGALRHWGPEPTMGLSAGQHQAGTCRMGMDPERSVTDTAGRVWGHDNLYVCDGALHPTNGGFNPFLTIMAMSYRIASGIAGAPAASAR